MDNDEKMIMEQRIEDLELDVEDLIDYVKKLKRILKETTDWLFDKVDGFPICYHFESGEEK